MVDETDYDIGATSRLQVKPTADARPSVATFRAQVDHGLRELDEGKGIPHEVVKRRMSKWLAA